MRQLLDAAPVRYISVGMLSLALDLGLLMLLVEVLGVWPPAAAVASYLLVFVMNFLLNRYWTFGAGSGSPVGQFLRFSLLAGMAALVMFLGMVLLTSAGVFYPVGKVMMLGLLVPVNFVLSRRWVFDTR